MQAITITSGHATRIRKVEPHEPVQRNIYQSNTYRKDLNWLHLSNELRVQKEQQLKDQQSSFFSLYKHMCK